MTSSERQTAILEVLCRIRRDTINHLAEQFGVSRSTIRRDILSLSCMYPLRTERGHYGGVYVEDWFHLNRKYLSHQQTDLLKRLLKTLDKEDAKIMRSILAQFALIQDFTAI